ncbi:hypothetical protein NLG97_g8369 [Lecanicillium saksenae]|uniref:Uncharacterized protein n=1 Tax=Lecanicillium saksenae TaxID=468837 RepID=A0ACC1QM51_9HYPO|nr:hypothetical protein NLG97_g8369 [Lecanicillium saksenae]
MPVTLQIVNHGAETWKGHRAKDAGHILQRVDHAHYDTYMEILATSFTKELLAETNVSAMENGLVQGALEAYSTHHHLTIRPEDVWFAILSQLSFYINANAEKLRSFFVNHQGKKELVVNMVGTRHTVDFGVFAQTMADKIGENVKDPELRDWVMPSFSTTTDVDCAVGGVLFMGAMQSYFEYTCMLTCGLPSVTLLGEVADYRDILKRLDMLDRLGQEPAAMAQLLRPVLEHMILTFTEGRSPRVVAFWNKIVSRHDLGSGSPYISGWLTAFCFWNPEGKKQGGYHPRDMFPYLGVTDPEDDLSETSPNWLLCNTIYPEIDISDIPPGSASVPVLVNDNGEEFKCTMVAGLVAVQAASPTAEQLATISSEGVCCTSKTAIQPMSGWFIFINEDQS